MPRPKVQRADPPDSVIPTTIRMKTKKAGTVTANLRNKYFMPNTYLCFLGSRTSLPPGKRFVFVVQDVQNGGLAALIKLAKLLQ